MKDARRHLIEGLIIATAVALAASLAACFPDYSCTEVGCTGNLQCNATTGKCEKLVQSCTKAGCPDGKVCDPATGVCRSEGARCVDNSCPAQQVCNAQTGYCEARLNCEIDPCTSPAEQCDRVSGQCVPLNCANDRDCPVSFYCSSSGECRSGCRIGDDRACPAGQFCRGNVGDTIGQCRDECHSDDECPLGQICQQTRDGSSCEAEPICETDEDCRAEGVCIQHVCQPPPCTADADCATGEVCDVATGVCVGGDCQEDIHAPNQSIDQAAALRPGSYTELELCPGQSDWFSMQLRSSDTLRLRMKHAASADLDIFVYAPDGTLLASNQQTSPLTTLEMVSQRAQTVAIQIRGTTMQAESYDLSVERNPDQTFCRDDTSEENDTPSEAVVLPTDSNAPFELALQLCGADPDWFVLGDLGARQGLSVTLSDAAADVALDLYTPDDQVYSLGGAGANASDELRMQRVGAPGDYLVRVRSRFARSGSYRLRTQVLDPMTCADAGTHRTADTAVSVPTNTVQRLALCPLDQSWEVDWIALDPPPQSGTLTAQIVAVGDLPALDVVLFEKTPGGLTTLRRAASVEGYYQVRVPVDAAANYLLRISAEGEPARIINGVDYQAFYRFESAD